MTTATKRTQLERVYNVMRDGEFRSLSAIANRLGKGTPTTSISARMRDFRKAQFGAYDVKIKTITRKGRQVNLYQLVA